MKIKHVLSAFVSVIPATVFAAVDPEHVALVDTGYDVCVRNHGHHCEENKNLLFRGGQPLPDEPPYEFSFKNFRENIFAYLKDFNQTFSTSASLPKSTEELKNYRIVIINLLYDYNEQGGDYELKELQYEFKQSGHVSNLQIPEQHKMYGLDTPFNPKQYAFQWWPVTFAKLNESDSQFVPMFVNWPDKMGTPPHSFEPKEYKVLNFPYLVTGISYSGINEPDAKDLQTLLQTIPRDQHPLLIFYHCVAGKDRTGALSAAYFMEYGGYPYFSVVKKDKLQSRQGPVSLAEAMKFTIIPDRIPNQGSKKLSKAYCLWLGRGPCI